MKSLGILRKLMTAVEMGLYVAYISNCFLSARMKYGGKLTSTALLSNITDSIRARLVLCLEIIWRIFHPFRQ
jgi:hypothetical protein